MEDVKIILAGLPGDMATRINDIIDKTEGVDLARLPQHLKGTAFTGNEIKGKPITAEFCADYYIKNGIGLTRPKYHKDTLDRLKSSHNNLFGINFATADGYDVNFMFVENNIPFISGVTGVSEEKKSEVRKAVKRRDICAVIDQNMNPAVILADEMLRHISEICPGALNGYSGYGIDSHQSTKQDPISGTLDKWVNNYIEPLGVTFYAAKGDRTGAFGHGYHDIRIMSPDGTTEININTRVLGRSSYAHTTIEKILPFLVGKMDNGEKGKVYSTMDSLKG